MTEPNPEITAASAGEFGFRPAGQFEVSNPAKGTITLSLTREAGKFQLAITNKSGDLFRKGKAPRRALQISGDTEITFELEGDVDWQWDCGGGPFRLKNADAARFYRLKSCNAAGNSFVVLAQNSGHPAGSDQSYQPFNLCLTVGMIDGEPLLVCIDPDTWNPPKP